MKFSLATILALALVLSAVAAWWFLGYEERTAAITVGVCVVGAATIFTLTPQIDWWWYTRYPPVLDANGTRLLATQMPYFQELAVTEKKRFASRVAMVLMDKEFVPQGTPDDDELPEELKIMVAASIVQLTFGLKEYWLSDLEKIITYPRLFPSHERPLVFHAGEAHDDGCVILSIAALHKGFIAPAAHYHIGLHTAAEYWNISKKIPETDFIFEDKAVFIQKITELRLFIDNFWTAYTGLAEPLLFEQTVECFFAKADNMKQTMPKTYAAIAAILNQDPTKLTYPIMDRSLI